MIEAVCPGCAMKNPTPDHQMVCWLGLTQEEVDAMYAAFLRDQLRNDPAYREMATRAVLAAMDAAADAAQEEQEC